MKQVFIFLLGLFALQATAQHKKAPGPALFYSDTYNDLYLEPQNKPDSSILRTGIRTYRKVTFTSGYGVDMDTSNLSIFKFDRQGRIEESKIYIYATGEIRTKPRPPFEKFTSRVFKGTQTSYTYDAKGNVISLKEADLYVPGTEAFARQAVEKATKARFTEAEQRLPGADVRREAFQMRFLDSLLAANATDEPSRQFEYRYDYDADGNILRRSYVTNDSESMQYGYKYNEKGQVIVKSGFSSSIYHDGSIKQMYYSVREGHYTYTPEGRPASVHVFELNDGTTNSNLANPDMRAIAARQLYYQVLTHYDAAGNPDTIAYLGPSSKNERHINVYQGNTLITRTIVKTVANGKDSTASHFMYRYKNGRLVEAVEPLLDGTSKPAHPRANRLQ